MIQGLPDNLQRNLVCDSGFRSLGFRLWIEGLEHWSDGQTSGS